MYPKYHILYGAIFSLVLIPLFGIWNSLIVFLASFLIDMDHYTRYVYEKKDFSIIRSIKYYYNKSIKRRHEIYLLHTVECWILLLLLGYYNPIFIFILLGFLFHMACDFIDMINKKYYEVRVYSIVIWMLLKL
jgi:hypothetical protein